MTDSTPKRPYPPLPEPLRAAETGTYTHESVVVRLPDIGRDMLAANEFVPATRAALEAMIAGIPEAGITQLEAGAAPDASDWASYIAPYEGQNWLEIPWFFAETYFYRRIVETTGYFDPAHPHFGLDPFAPKKWEGLAVGRERIQAMLANVDDMFALERAGLDVALERLIALALWGNQADLSILSADLEGQPAHADREQAEAHTLVDDSAVVVEKLLARKEQRVDMILDNAGIELVSDLALTDFLLFSGTAETVYWHLKIHPTFVSDATIRDVEQTIEWLLADQSPNLSDLGRRLQAYIDNGRWLLTDHPFWNSSLPMWEMPEDLFGELGRSDLIITKGDANYRRLLGDLHWPFTTPFADIVNYAPAPLLALRTVKSEIIAGLTAEQVESLTNNDPEWFINGRWGLIQLVNW